jgi:hypothetical protein
MLQLSAAVITIFLFINHFIAVTPGRYPSYAY